jgi:Xaa-Pro aminopeptidase
LDLIRAKIEQAVDILNELNIDLWLIFCRETEMMADPAHVMVIGHPVVWQSAFFISRTGATMALVGNFDAPDFERSRRYDKVRPYVEDCGREIRQAVEHFGPRKLAVNYSVNDIAADGLSHGMYLMLCDYLKDTPYPERMVSAEELMARLRGRKIGEEVKLISAAAFMAADCWTESVKHFKTGMTEKNIADIIDDHIARLGGTNSFTTIVNAGAKTSPGHGRPTAAVLEPGDLLHIDFGARVEGFCSDIQRLAYFKRDNEGGPPDELTTAFNMVKKIIDETSSIYRPGVKGYSIDAVARRMLQDKNYEVYQHALGHQIGRSVHDGAAIVGPRWKRYGNAVEIPLEEGNTFTVELGIDLAGIGYVGLEEDLVVTEKGGKFLCPRQTELIII